MELKEKSYLIKTAITDDDVADNVVVFGKPYTFEGETYYGVDCSCIDDLTGADLCAINKRLNNSGNVAAVKELDYEFCKLAFTRAANIPVELLDAMPAKEFSKVMRRVSNYFFGEE